MIQVRFINVDDKVKVTKEDEVLVTCSPVICIKRHLQATVAKSFHTLITGILHRAESNTEQKTVSEKLLLEFKVFFSGTPEDVGRATADRNAAE